ncbi:MAG: hypothetical protein U0821_23745 [Chloroflexota bacterium]
MAVTLGPRGSRLLAAGLLALLLSALVSGSAHAEVSGAPALPSEGTWRVIAGDDNGLVSLKRPVGLAPGGGGSVWVALSADNAIQRIEHEGALLDRFGTAGTAGGQLREPRALATDGDGNVYVADTGNNRVQKLSAVGEPLMSWGLPARISDQIVNPVGVAVDAAGNVYIAYAGGRWGLNHRVDKHGPNGQLLLRMGREPGGAWGRAQGQFTGPHGVAVDAEGSIYVADTGNHRIQKFDAAGEFVREWGSQGRAVGQLDTPRAIAVAGDGDIFVADTGNDRIQRFSTNGAVIATYGERGIEPGQFRRPEGLMVDADGLLWVADTDNDRIQVFAP